MVIPEMATFRTLGVDDFQNMPWRNGGGQTLQMAIHPAGADLSNFDWRISMATIELSGPFSTFSGCDRTVTFIDGNGFVVGTGGEIHTIDQPLGTIRFSGDDPATCTLRGGPARDFGVITRRSRCRATLEPLRLSGSHRHFISGATVLVACLEGRLKVSGHALGALSLLWIEGEKGLLQMNGDAVVVVVDIMNSSGS